MSSVPLGLVNILLEKLNLKNWFESYRNNIKQFVIFNVSDSSLKPVSTGVPQRFDLGPLLFLVYINDLHKLCYHLTDDINMLQSDNSLKKIAKQMTESYLND